MAIHCNSKEIPLTLYFMDSFGKKYVIKKAWPNKNAIQPEELVEIKENMEIGLVYCVDNFEEFDSNSTLEIEMAMEHEDDQRVILLNPTERIEWIYHSHEDYPWRMGYYMIKFIYYGESYYTGFTVMPLHLNASQVYKLHTYLEEKITGIIHDSLCSSHFEVDSKKEWYLQYAKMVEDYHQEIGYFFRLLSKKTVTSIVGLNEISPRPGRMNKKSLQWQFTNGKATVEPTYSNKVKKEVIDTVENRWIKTILSSWLRELEEVEKQLIANQERKYIAAVSSLKHKVMYMLYKSFLSEVPLGNKKPLLKRPAYYKISLYYEQLKAIFLQREVYQVENYQRFKKTWKLYEFYCLFIVLDSFKSKGYKLKYGIDKVLLNKFNADGIPQGTCFVLENEKFVVKVWYDKETASSRQEAIDRNEEIYCLGFNKRPDIRIDYYKNEQGRMEYISTIVMDAKFRKLNNIRSERACTATQLQLFSYWQMAHVHSVRPNVENVICLYANDGIDGTKEIDQTITYIKLFPDVEDGTVTGMKEIIDII